MELENKGRGMDLREFLFKKNISIQEFADKIGYSRTHISLIVNGKAKPSKRLEKSIETAIEEIKKEK